MSEIFPLHGRPNTLAVINGIRQTCCKMVTESMKVTIQKES